MKKVINKVVITLAVLFGAVISMPSTVFADEQTCTSVYGGGVVCGVKTPDEHKTVEAGVANNPLGLASILLLASGSLHYLSNKSKRENLASGR